MRVRKDGCFHVCTLLWFIGVDFKIKTVELRGKKIRLQIWWVEERLPVLQLWNTVPFVCRPVCTNQVCPYLKRSTEWVWSLHFDLYPRLRVWRMVKVDMLRAAENKVVELMTHSVHFSNYHVSLLACRQQLLHVGHNNGPLKATSRKRSLNLRMVL